MNKLSKYRFPVHLATTRFLGVEGRSIYLAYVVSTLKEWVIDKDGYIGHACLRIPEINGHRRVLSEEHGWYGCVGYDEPNCKSCSIQVPEAIIMHAKLMRLK